MPLKAIYSTVQLLVNGLINLGIVGLNILKLLYNCLPCVKDKAEYKNHKYYVIDDSWSFAGVVRDAIATLNLGQRALNSIWLFVWTPPAEYRPFKNVCSVFFDSVFKGSYHTKSQLVEIPSSILGTPSRMKKSTIGPRTIKEVWDGFLKPNYLRQISPRFTRFMTPLVQDTCLESLFINGKDSLGAAYNG